MQTPPTPCGLGLTPGQTCADPALIPTPLRHAAVTGPVFWGPGAPAQCRPPTGPCQRAWFSTTDSTRLPGAGRRGPRSHHDAEDRLGLRKLTCVSRAPQDCPRLVEEVQSAGGRGEANGPRKGQVLSEAAGSGAWCREGPMLGKEAGPPPLERMETCVTIGLPFPP